MKLQIARVIGITGKRTGRIALVTLAVALAIGFTSVSALAAGPVWQLDGSHSTARLFLGSSADPESLNVGVARVSGKTTLDPSDQLRSRFDLIIYPAGGGSRGLDEKLEASKLLAALYTEMSFKSTRIVAVSDGNLEVSGNLTLTRVEATVTMNPDEAYSGPVYSEPVVHRVSHQVTFVFPNVDSPAPHRKGTTRVSATARIGYENFPQLSSAIVDTNWPLVVEDANCQVPSTVGEDYAGSSCTRTAVPVISRAVAPSNVGEDYHGFEITRPSGNQVTIELDLAGIWAASGSQIAGN